MWGVKSVPGRKQEGREKLLEVYFGEGAGAVVVEVVSNSRHNRGSLQDQTAGGKHFVLLHNLFCRTGVTAVFNFYLITLGLAEIWDFPHLRPEMNSDSREYYSPEEQFSLYEKVHKSLAELIQWLEYRGTEE